MLGGFGAEANDNLLVEGELRSVSNCRQKNRYERAFLGCSRGLLRLRTFSSLAGLYGGFPLKRLSCLLLSCLAAFSGLFQCTARKQRNCEERGKEKSA